MVVNGNLTVGGKVTADALLFTEITALSDMATGINIYLIDGRLYYKIDSDNTFMYYSKDDIDSMISDIASQINNGGTSSSSSSSTTETIYESDSLTQMMNLLNTTFFPIIDGTVVYLTSLNFDTTGSINKATFLLDKIQASTYKNGKLGRIDYWTTPTYYLNTYINEDLLPLFKCQKFDNYAITTTDQTKLNQLYLENLFNYNNSDISTVLDNLIKDTSDTSIIYLSFDNIIFKSFFTFNWLNFKIDSMNMKAAITELHKKAFSNESIFYFFENYASLYNYQNITRIKYYFFDYKFFVKYQCLKIIDYIKEVYDNCLDYTNTLSSNIQLQKSDNSFDLSSFFPYDFTAYQSDISISEILEAMFNIDITFRDKIAQEDLSVQIKVHKQQIPSLNVSTYTDLDFSNAQMFSYNGEEIIYHIVDKMNISQGEFYVPIIEIDVPLDSYFYFMI